MRIVWLIALGLAGLAGSVGAQEATVTGFLDRAVTIEGKSYPYVVYVPRAYRAEKPWPAILFLHGAGERGSDGLKQSEVGLGRAVRMNPERYPAITVFPQCPTGDSFRSLGGKIALMALDATLKEFKIDEKRQYLTGLSMGGYGTWAIAAQFPERFAALVPICGGGEPATMAPRLKGVPIWVFHGDADQAVPVARSREMVEAIKGAGSTVVKYTEYPGVGHNSWDAAYGDAEMATWLFSQHR